MTEGVLKEIEKGAIKSVEYFKNKLALYSNINYKGSSDLTVENQVNMGIQAIRKLHLRNSLSGKEYVTITWHMQATQEGIYMYGANYFKQFDFGWVIKLTDGSLEALQIN